MKNENRFQRILKALEHKGFYMILGLCVMAIGVSAYVLFFTTPPAAVRTGEVISGEIKVPKPDSVQEKPAPQPPKAQVPEKKPVLPKAPVISVPKPEKKSDKPAETAKEPVKSKSIRQSIFTLPIRSGEVQRGFSGSELVPDPTMKDWRTHNGTDFSCSPGDEVLAVLDGVVSEIYEDPLFGCSVCIDHGAGLQSVYCGVAVQDGLKEGKHIAVGQTIGRVGSDNLAESAQSAHLHLEMLEDGRLIDPMTKLKVK